MKNKLFFTLLMTLLALQAGSQELIQKATKTMDYRFEDCSSVQIQGEKATIRITGKPQQTVELKISLVSKHKNPKTAQNDLKYIRFVSEKVGTKLILKNFYESANRKIESNLSIIYDLSVPEEMAIQLQNLYGAVTLLNLSGSKSIGVSFGRLDLSGIGGTTNLQLRYSNLTVQKILGKLTGTLSKSDAVINNCGAATELDMQYGILNASLLPECEQVRVTGNRTEVILQTSSTDYKLDLKTNYSDLEVFGKAVNSPYRPATKSSSKSIFVSTSYCPIKIKLK